MQMTSKTAHPIPPVFDQHSEILILGSFPSVKSREEGFFYGHPKNRFWRVMADVFGADVPKTVPEKKDFLLKHHVALWDVIGACEIKGSSDASIQNVSVNDLTPLLSGSSIRAVFTNGKTAWFYYHKYAEPKTGIPAVLLPSTSPANASWTYERLTDSWRCVRAAVL